VLTPQGEFFLEWENVFHTEPSCLFFVKLKTFACHVRHIVPSNSVLLREALIFVQCKCVANVMEIIRSINDSIVREVASVLFPDVVV